MSKLKIFILPFILFGMTAACSIPGRIQSIQTLPVPTTDSAPSFPTHAPDPTLAATGLPLAGPTGKIVFACQVFAQRLRDQVCIINADGSGFKRLTTNDYREYFYPSLAPDGNNIVFSSNQTGDGKYELYEMDLQGNQRQLTNEIGILTSPEISPDGSTIAFTHGDGISTTSVWVMDRNGNNPRQVFSPGWDPTWSPDGQRILFASNLNGDNQLYTVRIDGSDLNQITTLPNLRGRSDWSPDGRWIVTYSGEPWHRDLYLMASDGSNPAQISPPDGNSQGPAFSPDGQWVVFTAYFGNIGVDNGCEIYIMRTDGTQLTRLTNNAYCDYQPRWGP